MLTVRGMGMSKTILVTGGNGQLGNCLREIVDRSSALLVSDRLSDKYVFTDVAELDITSVEAVRAMFALLKPDWVVNCAAYTDVERAESNAELARLLNATAVGVLAEESARIGASLLHISTDYVFRGDDPRPRVEEDVTDPQSVYGVTKLEGERFAALNPRHVIIRTSWLYSTYGNNFVKTMRRLGGERSEVTVVADQWGSPTSAHDLAQAILVVIQSGGLSATNSTSTTSTASEISNIYGTYHYSNLGTTSWAIFAEEIMRESGLDCKVRHLTTAEYPTVAKRPEYSIMCKEKFCKTFGVDIPEWEASLEDVIHLM